MNIELLQEKIDMFSREVVDSGFKRDLQDYIQSLPSAQDNIVTLREIAGNVLSTLDTIYEGDLPDSLKVLLPIDKPPRFTDSPHHENLRNLVDNKEVTQKYFFDSLSKLLNELHSQILQNIETIDSVKNLIAPYLARDKEIVSEQDIVTISISFKEQETITNLPKFTKTLNEWNNTLPIYHQLLKSESPKDIQILEVQNGSINLILNLNIDIGLNLAQLFKVGFGRYIAYLEYKTMIKSIINSYHGNKNLIESEKEREKLLLENIGVAVEEEIKEQHNEAKNKDKQIDTSGINGKVREVKKLVTSHIIKGNDIKLLSVPQVNGDEGEEGSKQSLSNELRKSSMEIRKKMKLLLQEDKQKLLDMYTSPLD